jgi:hypothetical protein
MGVDGKVTHVKCKICIVIEGQDKLLVLKLDLLWKHVGQKKATIASASVAVGDFYFLKMNQHVLNEKLYVQKGKDFVWHKLLKGFSWKGKKLE